MGLDMFAWRVKAADVIDDFTVRESDDGSGSRVEEFFYWRKHHDLHGWMNALYRTKGGTKEFFNCVKVRLSLTDLDQLEKDVSNYTLPETTGFFFGDNPQDIESKINDLDFIKQARQIIKEGDAVYYDSWW